VHRIVLPVASPVASQAGSRGRISIACAPCRVFECAYCASATDSPVSSQITQYDFSLLYLTSLTFSCKRGHYLCEKCAGLRVLSTGVGLPLSGRTSPVRLRRAPPRRPGRAPAALVSTASHPRCATHLTRPVRAISDHATSHFSVQSENGHTKCRSFAAPRPVSAGGGRMTSLGKQPLPRSRVRAPISTPLTRT